MEIADVSNSTLTETQENLDSNQHYKYIDIFATDQMPALHFEIVEIKDTEDPYRTFYYPISIVIKADEMVIQQLDFDEEDFGLCTFDDFGFEYGDFKLNGYGGFKIYRLSLGKNPSYYVWLWDENENTPLEHQPIMLVW